MEIQKINSTPFTDSKFIDLVKNLSNQKEFEIFKKGYFIDDGVLYNIGNRDYVDYRPSLKIRQRGLEKRGISSLQLDSLTHEQVREISENIQYIIGRHIQYIVYLNRIYNISYIGLNTLCVTYKKKEYIVYFSFKYTIYNIFSIKSIIPINPY